MAAQGRGHGLVRRIAVFIAAIYDGEDFPVHRIWLRAVDEAISDDMLLSIDALRWGQANLYRLVPDGGPAGEGGHREVGPEWPAIAVTIPNPRA